MLKPELLAPVGDFECLKAAVQNGADAVYLGASYFNARASATNFTFEELEQAIIYAKSRNVKVHLALNTIIKEAEFTSALDVAKKAYEYGIDAIIVQDLGLASTLQKYLPNLPVHASTQMTVHNLEGVNQLANLGIKRVVLSRELSISEISCICQNSNIEIEAFVHGALCISYSGKCLFSSMIGGRSGNRGKCAQPCRLPYELIDENEQVLDNGYLLSPRDLFSLPFIPQLIKAGVDSFKIEGRLKTPEYVATVTRIYRKYIDMACSNTEYKIEEQDKTDLLQVFNRGGFSTGHLDDSPNEKLIYPKKPNHMGLFLGKITKFNPKNSYISLKLENEVSIGDRISIENNTYNVSELLVNNKNSRTATAGSIVTLGRMKGKIFTGDNVYKISSKALSEIALTSFENEVQNKRITIHCDVTVKKDTPVTLRVYCNDVDSIYNNLEQAFISDIIPIDAINQPITAERITQQLSKTRNTPYDFMFKNCDVEDGLYIPNIAKLNELRRTAIAFIEEYAMSKIKREEVREIELTTKPSIQENANNTPNVSLLLTILNPTYDYSTINGADRVYIPLQYFLKPKYKECIDKICGKFKTYIYMPTIMRNAHNNKIPWDAYKLSGVVISHISQLQMVPNGLAIIANYTLNIANLYSVQALENMGVTQFTISPELDKNAVLPLLTENSELIVYGNIPVMTSNYCVLGKSNKCHNKCNNFCTTSNKYYLKDRLRTKIPSCSR